MILRSALGPRARRWSLVALVTAGLATAGLSYVLVSSAGASSVITTGSLARFESAVRGRLNTQGLNYHWVVCVRSGNRFKGVPVVRCNVDFGEPHIVAYCSVLRDGRLLTSEDDPAIPCAHDNAGFSDPVVTYG